MPPIYRLTTLLIIVFLYPVVSLSAENAMHSYSYTAMLGHYQQLKTSLTSNQYGAPISIQSSFKDNAANGEVYALLDHDFDTVVNTLGNAGQWCDVLLLHVNVKGCENSAGQDASDNMKVYVGRNYYQTPDEAYSMQYMFAVKDVSEDFARVELSSADGPFGTSDYLITFEAIPFDSSKTFIHFKYAYQYGVMAKLAINSYLATLGRHKVGFSIESYDDNHEPVYVKGLQGIVERNSMRYFIAIRSYLDTNSLDREQWFPRVDRWYSLARPFNKQLIEVEDGGYLETKQQEYKNREKLSTAELKSGW